jgi:hypothetical protein
MGEVKCTSRRRCLGLVAGMDRSVIPEDRATAGISLCSIYGFGLSFQTARPSFLASLHPGCAFNVVPANAGTHNPGRQLLPRCLPPCPNDGPRRRDERSCAHAGVLAFAGTTEADSIKHRCPQTRLRDLAAHFARGLLEFSLPSNQRAQGMPGAGAPAAARVVVVSTRVSHHEYAGITRHSPRNGFNGFLRALPGDRACLPPSLTFRFRQLDTSVGASGPHDFAVRFSLARQARIRVHRIPPRVCDVASRPSEVGQDGGGYRSESGQSPRGIFS